MALRIAFFMPPAWQCTRVICVTVWAYSFRGTADLFGNKVSYLSSHLMNLLVSQLTV